MSRFIATVLEKAPWRLKESGWVGPLRMLEVRGLG